MLGTYTFYMISSFSDLNPFTSSVIPGSFLSNLYISGHSNILVQIL